MGQESLDIEDQQALIAWLRAGGHIGSTESPRVRVLTGGVSNRTVRVERPDGRAWVLKQALGKLRVSVDWFSDPARIHREALGLRWLAGLAPAGSITPLVFEDHEEHVLAMMAVPEPHENWKTLLLTADIRGDHVEQFARLLAAVHANAYQRRAELAGEFDDRSFFESLRLEPYYEYAGTQVSGAAGFMAGLVDSCRERRLTLVHGDYSPKNVLIHQGRLILLDHEVIHWGDPAFDLGFGLTHLLSKAHHLPAHRQQFAEAARRFWATYRAGVLDLSWASDLEPHVVRHTLGCLLARVAGRSPLEYLSASERQRQAEAVVESTAALPVTVEALTERFLDKLCRE